MHELALMESVVSAITERLGETRVTRVRLEVGQWAAVFPDALRFSFDVCTEGTSLAGAALEIQEMPAVTQCRACGRSFTADGPCPRCPCGSADLEWVGGQELRIKDVEVV